MVIPQNINVHQLVSYILSFCCVLFAMVMFIDVSQVDVTLFPSFKHFLSFHHSWFSFYIEIPCNISDVMIIFLCVGTTRDRCGFCCQIFWDWWSLLCSVWWWCCQPRPDIWGVQHGQAVGFAMHICMREQWIWYGNKCSTSFSQHRLLHKRGLCAWNMGKRIEVLN
jgi:hypothetical protein